MISKNLSTQLLSLKESIQEREHLDLIENQVSSLTLGTGQGHTPEWSLSVLWGSLGGLAGGEEGNSFLL